MTSMEEVKNALDPYISKLNWNNSSVTMASIGGCLTIEVGEGIDSHFGIMIISGLDPATYILGEMNSCRMDANWSDYCDEGSVIRFNPSKVDAVSVARMALTDIATHSVNTDFGLTRQILEEFRNDHGEDE